MFRAEAFLFEHSFVSTIAISEDTVLNQTKHVSFMLLVLEALLTVNDILLFAIVALII